MSARSFSIESSNFDPTSFSVYNASTTARDVVNLHGTDLLVGKTAVVTGGSTDLGLEICKALAYAGCKVIMATRSIGAAERAIADEIAKPGQGKYVVEDTSNIIPKQLDMSDLLSIKLFANDLIETMDRIDILVLNECVIASKKEFTSAGFEKHIGINHFGHAYLTSLLQPKLVDQDFNSRIIVITSSAHSMGYIKLSDLHYKNGRHYSPWNAYANSKLANILFTKKLAEELKGTSVTAVSVHPGIIGFNIRKELKIEGFFTSFLFSKRKSVPQGAGTVIWACVDSIIDSDEFRGGYISDFALKHPSSKCDDQSLIDGLWNETKSQLAVATQNLEIDFRIQRSLSISSHIVDHNSPFSTLYGFYPNYENENELKEENFEKYGFSHVTDDEEYDLEPICLGFDDDCGVLPTVKEGENENDDYQSDGSSEGEYDKTEDVPVVETNAVEDREASLVDQTQ